jgi:hypothetical protein
MTNIQTTAFKAAIRQTQGGLMTLKDRKESLGFTIADAQKAADDWGFNCGPAALCAITGKTPNEIRPQMGDFERKGYTNPTLMFDVLKRLGVRHRQVFRADYLKARPAIRFGLWRVQWDGPWTMPGVPMAARYWHTHWVAVADFDLIYDVNAMCVGGWLTSHEWSSQLVPWLIREACPKGNGGWWVTHGIEVGEDAGAGEQ